MESGSVALSMSSVFHRLRLWGDAEPQAAATPSKPLAPQPMITYDKGLPSLPDDVIYEIFGLLDTETLKSCSLTGQAISRSAKPFIHRSLYLTPRDRPGNPKEPNTPGNWNEFKGLPALGERGLLQHTRHLSIFLSRNPLFPHDLRPHIQHLRVLTNLRSLKTRWLDIPSFIPNSEEYFGAFLESLESLELEHPRGDYKQIIYFVCQFPNLRNLKIKGTQDHIHSMRNGGPHFDIKNIPPLDGTLDLELNTRSDEGAHLVLNGLITLPLKFRSLRLLWCSSANSQLLMDTCAPNLERMSFVWHSASDIRPLQLSFKRHPMFRKLEITLVEWANTELFAGWLSGILSTISSNAFTELTIDIARVAPLFYNASENQVREWNSVDNVLDRLSLCEDVTLVVRPQLWVIDKKLEELLETYFPLMWENGRVVLEGPPRYMEDGPVRGT